MEDSVKNNADTIIFHTPICAEASQIGLDATIEIASANFYCAIPMLRFGMEDKMKKIKLTLTTLILLLTLSACSQKEISINIKDLSDQLLQQVAFEDELVPMNKEKVALLYNIENAANEYVYVGSGATAEEIAVFEFNNTEEAKNALQAAKNRISQQKSDYATYNPKEIQKLDNAVVKNTGRYLIVCVSEGDTAKKIIGEYTN